MVIRVDLIILTPHLFIAERAAATRRSEIRATMAKKTKNKMPRGGQEVSSFLQGHTLLGHTTWEADTIQNIIAAGRFGTLADVAFLLRMWPSYSEY